MRGFAHRHTVEAALAWLDAELRPPRVETVPLGAAAGRVLAEALVSDVDVPGFDRATMDGYALVAESTEGASSYVPVPLVVVGDSLPGHPCDVAVPSGQAVRIMTGAPVPAGCDAVLPAEWVDGEVGQPGPDGSTLSRLFHPASTSAGAEKTSFEAARCFRPGACCCHRIWEC